MHPPQGYGKRWEGEGIHRLEAEICHTFHKLPKLKEKNRLTFRGEQKIELMFHGKFLSQFKIKLHFPTTVYWFSEVIVQEHGVPISLSETLRP